MTIIEQIQAVQRKEGLIPDGIAGPKTWKAIYEHYFPGGIKLLTGDGTWEWMAIAEEEDIVVLNITATCFGGANDPQDSGETSSGVSTKDNPDLKGCALPMIYHGSNKALKKALGGSPLPKVPWFTNVVVEIAGKSITVPVIDLGPAKNGRVALDLTIAAAREFNPNASATNFLAQNVTYRILGGAKYVL